MVISNRLRTLRKEKNLSQGDIAMRTGLLRCYVSRIENGHTIPSIGTLEKIARALGVPLYQLFYEGNELPERLKLPERVTGTKILWGSSSNDAPRLAKFRHLLGRMQQSDRRLLVFLAKKMAVRRTLERRRRVK
jgi:transcriptional regulator with XRE-family HTH domain